MEELFGVSINRIMVVLLAIFLAIMSVVVFMAWRNRIMLKLALRNIPRRRAQTVLIIVGSMLSAVIIAAAFGTGDTISFTIRDDAVNDLGGIDEFLFSARDPGSFGQASDPYFSRSRFDELATNLADFDAIDGMVPFIGEIVPTLNTRTYLTEGQMRVTAPDPDHLGGFGPFVLASGVEASFQELLKELPEDGVYINDKAAEELDARLEDEFRLYLGEEPVTFRVKGIVNRNGLAGIDPTILLPLRQAQLLFDKPDQINGIAVSNRGGVRAGVELSEEVTERLRVFFADRRVAEELVVLLNQEAVLQALEERKGSLSGNLQGDVAELRKELPEGETTDRVIRLLSDRDVADEVLKALGRADLRETELQADTLFNDLAEIRVVEIKRFLLDLADQAGSGITTIFIMFGLFSIVVGILLIFLIFVMLAAARRTEMGMARAVGAKRSHLVQMFVFEGTAYDLAASTVGTTIGLLVSLGLVAFLNYLLGRVDADFSFTYHLTAKSAIVAFCLGMIIVFITASVSAYRVSRMNIAEAVRGLPETIALRGEASFIERLLLVGKAIVQPFIFLWQAVRHLVRGRFLRFWLALGGAVLWAPIISPVWWVGIVIALVRFAWPYLRRGWLTFLLGLLLVYVGVGPANQLAWFNIGSSLMIMGIGLMLRLLVIRIPALSGAFGILVLASGIILLSHGVVKGDSLPIVIGAVVAVIGISMTTPVVLKWTEVRAEVIDRLAFTFIGVVMLAYWLLPFDVSEPITGVLEDDIEMFFISGITMVTAAVWTVMYNADLLLKAISSLTSGAGKLRPVLVTAVAYPMSAKFRTGLTLAMFSLVVFTLIVMSFINEAYRNTFSDPERVLGGWDIVGRVGTVSVTNPIGDIDSAIEESPHLSLADFEAIGGYVWAQVQVRQLDARNQLWERYVVRAADDEYLAASRYDFKIIAEGYGSTKEEVWDALRRDASLAVIDASALEGAGDGFSNAGPFKMEGVSIQDKKMVPIEIDVLEPLSEKRLQFTIIGVLDSAVDANGIITSKTSVDAAFSFPIPLNTYRFRVAEGVDVKAVSKDLEAAFLENGMETQVLEEELADIVTFINNFYNLLTGYMGLGLVVGIAALGVISIRNVVERRQQIGVLRAIGYRQGMIQLSFLLESSFIALLGVALGVALGTIISFNLVNHLGDELEGLRFTVPWVQIVIIVAATYIFSILTTILPARQASHILPAEALRYE